MNAPRWTWKTIQLEVCGYDGETEDSRGCSEDGRRRLLWALAEVDVRPSGFNIIGADTDVH